jgi:Xaa-Pro aminopeptidase
VTAVAPPPQAPSVSRGEFAERRRRAVAAARERGLDGLLVWSRGGTTVDYYGDVMYLTNHHSPFPPNTDTPIWSGRSYSAFVLPVDGEPALIADLPDPPLDRIHVDDVRPTLQVPQTAARVLRESGLDRGRLGLVGRDSFLVSHLRALEGELGAPLRFEPADELLEALRRIKSPTEIELMRHAARVGVSWMTTMMEAVEEGKTEGHFVGEGLRFVATQGGYPYDVAVASGPRSFEFERIGIPSWDYRRPLERGDLVHVDMWGPVECYYTDFVRSTVVGRSPTDGQRQVLESSVALIEHLVAGMRPGVTAGGLYERGASWLVDNGFGAHRGESIESGTVFGNLFPAFGHGIGLGLEPPWLIEREPTVLEPGMVIAVECTVGLAKVGAAGFEQDVLVTVDGCEVLTADCPARWWD